MFFVNEAGEEKTRAVRTLSSTIAQLHPLWQESEEGREAKALRLSVGLRTWYDHLHKEHYQCRKPCKRVDVCDTCLEFERKGAPLIKAATVSARTAAAVPLRGLLRGFR